MIADDLVKLSPWAQTWNQDVTICKALGGAVLTWPSGRQTVEFYGSNAMCSALEVATAVSPHVLTIMKEQALVALMASFRSSKAIEHGLWVRHKKRGRRQARKIASVEWIHPNELSRSANLRAMARHEL